MNARVKQQGGWAGSFVIVGVLLALLLVGGVYFLKSYPAGDDTVAVDTSKDEKTTDEKNEKGSSSNGSGADTEQTPGENELPSGGQDVAKLEDSQETLPVTGPSETVATSLILALLTSSGVAYVRSRRHATL